MLRLRPEVYAEIVYLIVLGVGITISAWIVTRRMRRRFKKALRRNASDAELTSIKTWMKVEEEEEQEAKRGPLNPT
ncbi:MAG: hypothetical protein DMG22_01765 [Acidobacteria bacterium]|nr:MAG: hypothetical protein DMG22_01765 [Acidobacteriota bacterium]